MGLFAEKARWVGCGGHKRPLDAAFVGGDFTRDSEMNAILLTGGALVLAKNRNKP